MGFGNGLWQTALAMSYGFWQWALANGSGDELWVLARGYCCGALRILLRRIMPGLIG